MTLPSMVRMVDMGNPSPNDSAMVATTFRFRAVVEMVVDHRKTVLSCCGDKYVVGRDSTASWRVGGVQRA